MYRDLLTLTRFRLAVVGMVCLGRCDSLCALHHRRAMSQEDEAWIILVSYS